MASLNLSFALQSTAYYEVKRVSYLYISYCLYSVITFKLFLYSTYYNYCKYTLHTVIMQCLPCKSVIESYSEYFYYSAVQTFIIHIYYYICLSCDLVCAIKYFNFYTICTVRTLFFNLEVATPQWVAWNSNGVT